MQQIKDFYELTQKRRERFQRKYCLYPKAPRGCSKNFGAAHTVQRAMLEKYLAEKQHVLKFSIDTNPKLGVHLFYPELAGINKATTFYGFCGAHDNNMFLPLEGHEFTFSPQPMVSKIQIGFYCWAWQCV